MFSEQLMILYQETCMDCRKLIFWSEYNRPGQSGAGCPASKKKKNILQYSQINCNVPNGGKLHFHGYLDIQLDVTYNHNWCALICGDNNQSKSRSNRPRLEDDNLLLHGGEISIFTESCDSGAKLHLGGQGKQETSDQVITLQKDPTVCDWDYSNDYIIVRRDGQCEQYKCDRTCRASWFCFERIFLTFQINIIKHITVLWGTIKDLIEVWWSPPKPRGKQQYVESICICETRKGYSRATVEGMNRYARPQKSELDQYIAKNKNNEKRHNK